MKNIGIYENLVVQLDKVARHIWQGSYKTRKRYYEAMKKFCKYLAEEYRLQKLLNISEKHIEAYVKHRQEKGLAPGTIKLDLCAIRGYHDQMSGANKVLPDNGSLNLAKRTFGGVNRTWEWIEAMRFADVCNKCNRKDYLIIAKIAYYAALRIEECFKLDTAQAEKAVKTGVLTVKGKGGLERDVPIPMDLKIVFEQILSITPRGQKLFVPSDVKTHHAKKRLQNFIDYNRSKFQNEDAETKLTFHGIRHTCAARWYEEFRGKGYTDYQARKQVSAWLGHGRDNVTRIYLASIKEVDKNE